MDIHWNDRDPIYRQLHDRLVELILEGVYGDGDALPSVRRISSDHRINPITVSRAYQLLVEEGIAEMRRGLGMYVVQGARETLAMNEREEFLNEEWPKIMQRMERLGLKPRDLLAEEKGNE